MWELPSSKSRSYRHQDELPYSCMYTSTPPKSSYHDQVKHNLVVFFLITNTTIFAYCCAILDETGLKLILALSSYRFLTKELPYSHTI